MNSGDTSTRDSCQVITGAFGFVGRYLLHHLLQSGRNVVGVDLFGAGQALPQHLGPYRLAGPASELPDGVVYRGEENGFSYVPCSLEDSARLNRVVAQLRPTAIFHLAAQSSAAVSFGEPQGTFASNLMGTLNLLEAVRSLPAGERPRLLSVGSGEEYGPHGVGEQPLAETAALNPLSPYAVSKVAQTLLCCQYAASYDLPVVVARAFSHTGPGQDTRFAYPSFARQIAAAEAGAGPTEILTGDLSPIRDFLDVRDVVAAYSLLLAEGRAGEIYNICAGRSLTIAQGLQILVGGATCPITVRQDPARRRPSDTPQLVGDNTKLRTETGWQPAWDLERTLLDLLVEARKEFQ